MSTTMKSRLEAFEAAKREKEEEEERLRKERIADAQGETIHR